MKKILVTLVAATCAFSASSFAAPAKSEKQAAAATQFRQALLQLVRSNVGALGGMAKGAIPMDAEKIKTNSMRIEQLSLMMDDYFAIDTRKFDVETEALPEVWENYSDFQSKIDDMTAAAKALNKAAVEGNEGQFKAKIGAVLKSCKGCHDKYKAE